MAEEIVQPAPVIEVKGLTKRFGDRVAVDSLDFSLYHGECMGLLGPNGAGKTTTIAILLGLVQKSAGQVRIFGQGYPSDLWKVKKRIGVAPQMDNLDPDLTVIENLLTYASYFDISRRTARVRAEELLEFFALSLRQSEVIQNLSGGMRRRLLIARALINSPDLLILDEPTIGLDPQARHLIWERITTLKGQGTTILLTSHYMEEVERLAGRVMVMESGRRVAEGDPQELVHQRIGQEVYEVMSVEDELTHLAAILDSCSADYERLSDRILIYVRRPCPELEALALSHSYVMKRPTNLEDLFLRLTGRTLREDR